MPRVNAIIRAEQIRTEARAKGLDASAGYWQATPSVLANITGGCGPDGFLDLIIPEEIAGVDLSAACQIHDWDYSPRTEVSRALADARFFANMRRLSRMSEGGILRRIIRRYLICKYFDAVDLYGGGFDYA